jgi:hypothetical protein
LWFGGVTGKKARLRRPMTGAFLWDCDGSVNRRREAGGIMLELPPAILQASSSASPSGMWTPERVTG